jgi:hypothetical protein
MVTTAFSAGSFSTESTDVVRILLCADAAALFSTARIQEAAAAWHLLLRRLLPRVTDALDAALDAAPTPDAPASVAVARLKGTLSVHPLSEDSHWPSLTSGDRTFTVYASAIQYLPSPRSEGSGPEDDIAIAATSVYNLGLCHHLQALMHGDRATSCFEKALRAYDAAQRMLEAAGFLEFLSSPPSTAVAPQHRSMELLLFAITNNVGHVFDQLHAHDVARRQLEFLHLLVASLGRSTAVPEADLASGTGPFAPFLLTTALHPCRRGVGPHHAPCA